METESKARVSIWTTAPEHRPTFGNFAQAHRSGSGILDPMANSTRNVSAPTRDAQAEAPATRVSLSRVGVVGVEKIIRVCGSQNGGTSRRRVPLPRRPRVLRGPQPRAGRRPHVPLRGGRQRGDRHRRPRRGAPGRGPGRPHRRARPRAPGRPPRRGEDRGPLPRDRPGPGLRPAHPGALHPLRHRRLLRTRHPHPHRRRGPGHDRLPLRPGPGRGRRPRSASPIRASTPTTIDRIVDAVPIATHNQRGIGTLYIGCPEDSRRRHRRPSAPPHRRELHVERDLRADEARRTSAPSSRRPTPTPASSRTASAR